MMIDNGFANRAKGTNIYKPSEKRETTMRLLKTIANKHVKSDMLLN